MPDNKPDRGNFSTQDPPRQPAFVRLGFLVLIIVLVSHVFFPRGKWEPYPAVLFPAGSGVMNVGEAVQFTRADFVAIRTDGEQERIDMNEFLFDLPDQYREPTADASFGLDIDHPDPGNTLTIGQIKINIARAPTRPADAEETRQWLLNRIEETAGPGEYESLIFRRIRYEQRPDRQIPVDTLVSREIPL